MKPPALLLLPTCLVILCRTGAGQDAQTFNAATFSVTCGDIRIGISEPKMWTMTGIYYKGSKLGVEESAYGTSFHITDVGQIGSAHKDVEAEDIKKLEFYLDDSKLPAVPTAELRGKSFKMFKISRIRDFTQEYTVAISGHRLDETTRVITPKPVRFDMANMCMHAWVPTVNGFLAGLEDEIEMSGALKDTEQAKDKFYIRQEVKWVAIYDPKSGKGAVSRVVEHPSTGGAAIWLWNKPGIYRKAYISSFIYQTTPAGFDGTYKMSTEFFEADESGWREEARKIGKELPGDNLQ